MAAVEAISRNFAVGPEEVALLCFNADRGGLEFLWPAPLRATEVIPLAARDSLAARTAREGRSFVSNRFAAARHAAVFESIAVATTREGRPLPIQKILSVPFPQPGTPGVIQLARKGARPEEAGADFSRGDIEALARLAEVFAPHLS